MLPPFIATNHQRAVARIRPKVTRPSRWQRYNLGMGHLERFVVRVTGRTGTVCWLSAPNADGVRTLTTRAKADAFPTMTDARVAIAKTPHEFSDVGLVFSVVSAD
jgi:hypothetical protein